MDRKFIGNARAPTADATAKLSAISSADKLDAEGVDHRTMAEDNTKRCLKSNTRSFIGGLCSLCLSDTKNQMNLSLVIMSGLCVRRSRRSRKREPGSFS
jgi:hypothetical protein